MPDRIPITTNELLPLKLDYVFRRIFGQPENTDALAALLCAITDIPMDEFGELTITDPEIPADFENDKYSRLDVKLYTKTGKVFCIEIQKLSEISDKS